MSLECEISEISFDGESCEHLDRSEESSESSSPHCPICEERDEELKGLRAELFHTRNESHEMLVQANSEYLQLLKAKLDVERELYYRIKREKSQLDQEFHMMVEDLFYTDDSASTDSLMSSTRK